MLSDHQLIYAFLVLLRGHDVKCLQISHSLISQVSTTFCSVLMTIMMISSICFCKALSCEMLDVFVGIVGVSTTYWNSLIWTAGEIQRAGERTYALLRFRLLQCLKHHLSHLLMLVSLETLSNLV